MSAPWSGGSAPGSIDRITVDGDYTYPAAVSSPRISFPFDGDSIASQFQMAWLVGGASNPTGFKYGLFDADPSFTNLVSAAFILEQEFQIAADFFSPLDLNTPYDLQYAPEYVGSLDLTQAILVNESAPQEIGGDTGLVKWTRTYAVIPPGRNEYGSMAYTYPGTAPTVVGVPGFDFASGLPQFVPGLTPYLLSDGSAQYQFEIPCRIQYDYFVLLPGDAFTNDTDQADSPLYIIPQFRVFYRVFINEVPTVFDNDYQTAGYTFQDVTAGSSTAPAKNTIPPKTTDFTDNDDDSGVGYDDFLTTPTEICVRASIFERWRGNIWRRITYFALAA